MISNYSHGAFLRSDLTARLGEPTVRAALASGRLVAYSRKVIIDRHRMFELLTRANAALLHTGPKAALTGFTAAWLHGCAAADIGVVHVLSGYDRKVPARPGLIVHAGSMDGLEVIDIEGLRVVALEMAIAEVLCTGHRPTALACVDQALALVGPMGRGDLHGAIEHRLATRPDPRGRRRAQALLDLATGRPESPAESALLLAIFDEGLPLPAAQVPVVDIHGRPIYRLDFGWEEPMVALEYDGHAEHEGRAERDAARDRDLAARGWMVVRATAADLRSPARLMDDLRTAFAARRFLSA
ncbi:endonuclease domain-containing protein [Actinokineospora sp.]|uniref:endonuclease domain-containing protein n=1 Tax=Actinokineospora sp. TaxID=1872133 RepID=UPI003D6B9BC6